MKKIITFLFVVFFVIANFNIVVGEEEYQVADASKGVLEIIDSFTSFLSAKNFYYEKVNQYDNLVLIENNKIIKMEDGIVNFRNDSSVDNTTYVSSSHGSLSFNSCFAAEGLYLNTSSDFQKVNFILSGDRGSISLDEVELIPYEMLQKVTSYIQKEGVLYHNIKNKVDSNYFAYSIKLDDAKDFLKDNTVYYCFDGHYFYEDFKVMANDYRQSNNKNAINSDAPYYNYYQYLPHRSYTNYTKEELENYLNNVLHFNKKLQSYSDFNFDGANDIVNKSQMVGELDAFLGYEKIYGSNAMMMICLAAQESSYGKSLNSFANNNLYSHAAFDDDMEREYERYNTIQESIYSYAKYIVSRLYAGMHNDVYYGSNFGNQLSGMNVCYSNDPYWGEKAASMYYQWDNALGNKDKDAYAIGIIDDGDMIKIYNDEELKDTFITLRYKSDYSFILLEDLGNAYKIQLDSTKLEDYEYHPTESIGYIRKNLVNRVLNEEKIKDVPYKEVTYDLGGGLLDLKDSITFYVKENTDEIAPVPYKEGYEFISYKDGVAQYKQIEKIEIETPLNNVVQEGFVYDLQGGSLKITYRDQTSKVIDIDSTMIENCNTSDQWIIQYCGVQLSYPITLSNSLQEEYEKMKELIDRNISSYQEDGSFNKEELNYIKNNIAKIQYPITMDEVRTLDKMLLETKRKDVNYTLRDSKYDVSISGLALSFQDQEESELIKPIKDTYYLEVKEIHSSAYQKIVGVASAYGFKVEESFEVDTLLNLTKTSFINPVVMSIKIKNKRSDRSYVVYHLDEEDNVIKCLTTQSRNTVTFLSEGEGSFVVLSLPSNNNYLLNDSYENISSYNSDVDMNLLFMEGIVIVGVGLLGVVLIVWDSILKKKEVKLWKDYKKSLPQAELPQEEKQKN